MPARAAAPGKDAPGSEDPALIKMSDQHTKTRETALLTYSLGCILTCAANLPCAPATPVTQGAGLLF